MPNINTVSFTFHDERKREEYGPMKKAEASITAAVADGEDGEAVLHQIACIATLKVRAALTIEGIVATNAAAAQTAPAESPAAAAPAPAAQPPTQPAAGAATPTVIVPPTTARIRRTPDEIARGLTVEQAIAERAAAASAEAPTGAAADTPAQESTPTASAPSEAAVDEWDEAAPAPPISDAELAATCSETAARLGDGGGAKVRDVKERFNPKPGEPFTVKQIPQGQRRLFLDQVQAL